MVFKRRNPRTYMRLLAEAFWPRGGWTRAFHYVRHRVRRLPDSPQRIARGVFAGVFTSFTPLFGLHFIFALITAKLVRGNYLAAILATFFGNPITFPIIALSAMKLGHLLLGTTFDESVHATIFGKFVGAGQDLKHNFVAIFTDSTAQWGNLYNFYNEIFLPYLVGGFVPGVIVGLICYYISEPLISAYQKRRRVKLKLRFEKLKARLHSRSEERRESK